MRTKALAGLLAAGVAIVALSAGGVGAHPQEGGQPYGFYASPGEARTDNVAFFEAPEQNSANTFSATIDWGDGSATSAGTITGGCCDVDADGRYYYNVSGTHTYANLGKYPLTVQIQDAHSGLTVHGFAYVLAPPLVARDFSAIAGQERTVVVADMESSAENPTQLPTTIDWGDGTPDSQATITPIGDPDGNESPNFEVTGMHTYASAGTYTVTVTQQQGDAIHEDEGTATVDSAPPEGTIDVDFTVDPGRTLIAGAPATFTPKASVSPADLGPLKLSWSFGDVGPPATDNDLANPSGADLGAGAVDCCAAVTHSYAQAFGELATKEVNSEELRKTYMVRLKATDKYGRSKTIARTVAVVPNQPPIAEFEWLWAPTPGDLIRNAAIEYGEYALFISNSHDPDNTDKTHDAIVKEEWDLDGDGTFEKVPIYFFAESFNPFLHRLGGRPPLSDFKPPYPVPYPYPIKSAKNPTKTPPGGTLPVTQPGTRARTSQGGTKAIVPTAAQIAREINAANAQALRDEVDAAAAAGPDNSGPRTVQLRVTDRSGATGTISKTIPVRPRIAPKADFFLRNAEPATDVDSNGQVLYDPIFADDPEYDGDGTILDFDLTKTIPDPRGKILYYVIEIGEPWQTETKGCYSAVTGKRPQTRQPVLKPGAGPVTQPGTRARAAATKKKKRIRSAIREKYVCTTKYGVQNVIKTVVSGPAKTARLTVPKVGTWSLLLTAFDETGATGKVRYDGLEVISQTGSCKTTARTFSYKDDKGNHKLSFAGTCVDNDHSLYWTREPIDLNGLKLAAPQGKWIIVDGSKGEGPVVYVSSQAPVKGKTWTHSGDSEGPLTLLLDEQALAKIPAGEQGAKLSRAGAGALLPANSKFLYKGLPAAGQVTLSVKENSSSHLHFFTRLPSVLGGATADVDIDGHNEGKKVILKPFSKPNAAAARARRGAARGRTAQTPAPPTVEVGDDLDLGGLKIPIPGDNKKLVFRYSPSTGRFEATAKNVLILNVPTSLRIAIRDGEFEVADGRVNLGAPGIQVGGGLYIDSFNFKITAQPKVQLVAGVHMSHVTHLIGGDGEMVMDFEPWHVGITAAVKVLDKFKFGEAGVDVYPAAFAFRGKTGYDFGPASFNATVSGVFGENAFNVEGSGKACLFACLGIKGLLSSKGVAACGSIDIDLVFDTITIEAGFGYKYGGDVDVMVGSCSISPYRVQVAGVPSAAAGKSAGELTRVVEKGQTVPIEVTHQVDALAIIAVAAQDSGATPKVTLIGPGDPPVAVVSTVPELGAVRNLSDPNVIVDQDTVAGQTRFVLGKPALGTWKLRVDEDSPPVTSVQTAETDLPVAKKQFAVAKVDDLKKPSDLVHGTISAAYEGFTAAELKPVSTAQISKGVVADQSPNVRTSTVAKTHPTKRLTVDAQLSPGALVTFAETGPRTNAIIATVKAPGLEAGPDAGHLKAQVDFAAQTDPDGHLGKHHIAAHVATPDGVPRGVIPDLVEFDGPKPSLKSPLSEIVREKRRVLVILDGDPAPLGASIGLFKLVARTSSGRRIVFTVTRADIQRVTLAASNTARVSAKRRAVKRWTVILRRIPRRDRVSVTLKAIRPPGYKGKVRTETQTLRARARSSKIKPRSKKRRR